MKKSKESLNEWWGTIEKKNIHIMRVSEGEDKENGAEHLFKAIVVEIWPSTYIKCKNPQRDSSKRDLHQNIIIKLSKIKERTLYAEKYSSHTRES